MAEVRKLGLEDLLWGSGTYTSPAGASVTRIPYPFAGLGTSTDTSAVIDVRAYGAVADDTSAATAAANTIAFQAAADACNTAHGGTIIVDGEYTIDGKITIYSGTIIKGKGRWTNQGTGGGGAVISGAFSGAIIEIWQTEDSVEVTGAWIENIKIDGLDAANGGYGVSVLGGTTTGNSSRQCGLKDVGITNCERGLYLNATQSFISYSTQIRDCTYGVWYLANAGTLVPQMVKFVDCDLRENTSAVSGSYVSGSKPYMWTFIGCHFEANGIGVYPANGGADLWSFYDCKFEQNDAEAVKIQGNYQFKFYGCYFNGNSDVNNESQVLIQSNYSTTPDEGNHIFEGCSFYKNTATYDISIKYTMGVRLTNCKFYDEDTIEIVNSYVEFDGSHWWRTPDPIVTRMRVVTAWIAGSDYPYKTIGLRPKHTTTGQPSYIFVDNITYHVTEAFTLTSGTTGYLKIGNENSAARNATGSVLATGIISPSLLNNGYTENTDVEWRATLDTNGAFDTSAGKVLVIIKYVEVPAQP